MPAPFKGTGTAFYLSLTGSLINIGAGIPIVVFPGLLLSAENKKHPAITMMLPTACIQFMTSPKKIKAKMAVKIGLKFRNRPEVLGPSWLTPMFQRTMHRTVEIRPVYRMDKRNEALTSLTVKSAVLNGKSTRRPNIPEYKMDIIGVTKDMAHLLQTE